MMCKLCSFKTFEFLDLGKQPMANKYPKKKDFKDEKFFRVKVYFCPNCKHVQLGELVSREEMFEDYYYLSSVNKILVKHYEDFARSKLKEAKFVVDVGSNDGISLKPLKQMGIKALGIDPSINVGKIANEAGYETIVDFLDSTSVKYIKDNYGQPDVVTGLSMFSHLQDPHIFLEDIKDLMTDDGKFIVEVEYNKTMLEKMAFERFYLDRINYFSVTSFKNLFNAHGMVLVDAEVTPIHGGSLRVTAQKKGIGPPPITKAVTTLLIEEEKNLNPKIVCEFGEHAEREIRALKHKLIEYKALGLTIAGYGSPARVATLTNFGDIGPDLIDFIVDDSPLKQRRYSPGKHIPIVSNTYLRNHPKDVILFFAYESYADIVKKLTKAAIHVFPIPVREV